MTKTNKVNMIWTGRDKYLGGRTIRQGDALVVSRGHARLHRALKQATDAPVQVAAVPATPRPQPPVQAPAPAVRASQARQPVRRRTTTRNLKAEDETKPVKRRYVRRDLQAED